MLTLKKKKKNFLDNNDEAIGYILSLLTKRCDENKFNIYNKDKLFKQLINIIIINSLV